MTDGAGPRGDEGGEVVALQPRDESPLAIRARASAYIAERFRGYAERAERGELVGAVVALVYDDGRIGTWFSPSEDAARQLAAVTLANHEYARHMTDDLRDDADGDG